MGQTASQNKVRKPKNIKGTSESVFKTPKTTEVRAEPKPKLPHNYENIVKDADLPIKFSSIEELYDHLHSGVFLNEKRQKYWIEKESGLNCFMVYARDLSVIWGEDKRYWKWTQLNETSDVLVDAVELLKVCWLSVSGTFDTSKLSPKTMYEILFVVMLNDLAYGWETPVNLRVTLPDGETKGHEDALLTKPRAEWIELEVGEFYTSPDKMGEVGFSLYECEDLEWKNGLIIKGVIIRPRKQC